MTTELSIERPLEQSADYRFTFESYPSRVRAVFAGVTIADSDRVMVMQETRLAPVYYFPREDVRMDLMTRTSQHSLCPFKGNASYWTLAVGEREAENVLWSYEDPYQDASEIKDYVAFYSDRLDAWYEDEQEISKAPVDATGYTNPLLEWLLHDASALQGSEQLTNALAER